MWVLTWGEVRDGVFSESNPVPISYRISFGNMTSYDWRSVSWRVGNIVHTSSPSAFGYFAGFMASIRAGLVFAASTIAKPALSTGAGAGFVSAAVAMSYAMQLVTGA